MRPVRIYTKTHCPYSLKAKALLAKKGVNYEEVDIEQHPERREEMIKASQGRTTVPEILIGDEWIGGAEDLQRLDQQGLLDGMLSGDEESQPRA